jgi:hypothetical protein
MSPELRKNIPTGRNNIKCRDRNPFQNLGFLGTGSGTFFTNLQFQRTSSGTLFTKLVFPGTGSWKPIKPRVLKGSRNGS